MIDVSSLFYRILCFSLGKIHFLVWYLDAFFDVCIVFGHNARRGKLDFRYEKYTFITQDRAASRRGQSWRFFLKCRSNEIAYFLRKSKVFENRCIGCRWSGCAILIRNVHFSISGAQILLLYAMRRMSMSEIALLSIFWIRYEKYGFLQCRGRWRLDFLSKNLNILPVALKIAIFWFYLEMRCLLQKV